MLADGRRDPDTASSARRATETRDGFETQIGHHPVDRDHRRHLPVDPFREGHASVGFALFITRVS